MLNVQSQINAILAKNATDVQSCRGVFDKHIAEHKDNPGYLVDLYLSYAGNEIKLKQFKKAKSIFETAASNPDLKNSLKLWIAFAKFYANRNKQGSTRKTYLRAVKQMTDEKNIQAIWKHFLQFENRSKMVPMSLNELKKLVNQTITPSSQATSSSNSITKPDAPQNCNPKKRPLLSRPTIDTSKFEVAKETMLFVRSEADKSLLPQLRDDTMSKLAYMFKLNTDNLFEIVLKMKKLQELLYSDLQLQGKIFENEVRYGNLRNDKVDFVAKSGKELRRIRRQMQSLLMQCGVPEVYLSENRQIIMYQQKILSVIVDAAILKSSRKPRHTINS